MNYCLLYRRTPIKLFLNNSTGFSTPLNAKALNYQFVYVGFATIAQTRSHSVHGLLVNNQSITYKNTGNNYSPNAYLAQYPNYKESQPMPMPVGTYPLCPRIFGASLFNPSRRCMPCEYFMFGGIHFGGPNNGCSTCTSAQLQSDTGIISLAFGFR